MTEAIQRTPLCEAHRALGAKMVPFAGWEMPVWYQGLVEEHRAVRTQAGLFDVSHMGEVFVEGARALEFLQSITCNDLGKIGDGKAQYNALPNEQGGIVDDIIVYRYNSERFLVCVNASNTDKDFAWMNRWNRHGVTLTNRSSEFGQIAIQGPKALEIVGVCAGGQEILTLKGFYFGDFTLAGIPVIAARTGYTGEDGFEFFVPAARTRDLWELLLEVGRPRGLVPVGLGARDTLRLEACLPLHGHELGDDVSALESGLAWIVKPAKGEFVGRAALSAELARGSQQALVGFFLDGAGIARHGDKVLSPTGQPIGVVTSGTKTPTVDRALGLARIAIASAGIGTELAIEVRGRAIPARVVACPFYRRPKN